MHSESLQNLHNDLLALQHAADASGNGFIQIRGDDTLSCDAHARKLLGATTPLNDLPDLLICLNESQHETLLDQLEAARERNLRIELELELDRADSTQPLLFTAQAANLPGKPGMSVCGFLREAPEPKSGDTSAALLEEAHSANVELANFASIASHDMREPLRMITSYLGLLQERSPESLDDRARKYIAYACDGAERMQHLIDDLLGYARLDKEPKPLEPLALEDILDTAINHLGATIKDTKATVTVEIDNTALVLGHHGRLARLFQNLIANGIKFTEPGKAPRVNITLRDGDGAGASGQWIVCIQDDGIGIDPDHHDMLFSLFRRLNTRDEYEGSGIGLAVCKKIAEQHGGSICLDSAKGKGSTFYVGLRKADSP